jgi:hypothetical protein
MEELSVNFKYRRKSTHGPFQATILVFSLGYGKARNVRIVSILTRMWTWNLQIRSQNITTWPDLGNAGLDVHMYEYCHVSGIPWLIITDSGLDDWISRNLLLQSIITAHNQWLSKTCSIPYWTTSVFYCDWLGSDSRICHFFSFHCPLVDTPLLNSGLSCERGIMAH